MFSENLQDSGSLKLCRTSLDRTTYRFPQKCFDFFFLWDVFKNYLFSNHEFSQALKCVRKKNQGLRCSKSIIDKRTFMKLDE